MGWKATGQPTVRKQRDKWVVRVDGIDTATGKHRPRQIGTYPSQRSANQAARSSTAERAATSRRTVSWLVRRYVDSRTDITVKSREGYQWAIPHIESGLGAIKLSRLERDDVTGWIDNLAAGGQLSRRSIQICRNVLKAALTDAVEEGLLPRNPAARVALPRVVAKPAKERDVDAWSDEQVSKFLATTADHRWAAAFRLEVLYGLRRSELLALRWDDLDPVAKTVRVDEGVVAIATGAAWSDGKNERSRRRIPLDDATYAVVERRRAEQLIERDAVAGTWESHDLIIATRTGKVVLPRSYDRALARQVKAAKVPTLTSHGLRHTAATHMVASATNLGELRAVADILGHSPEMLMRIYAHVLPRSASAVVDRIAERSS